MRCAWVMLLVLCASHAVAQRSNCDSIVWSPNRKLTWSDYRGHPVLATRVAASTHFSFVHSWRITDNIFIAKVVCIFEPCISWTKGNGSAELLAHEQGHFDIAEFFRRSYNKRVSQLSGTAQAVQQAEARIYAEMRHDCEQIQLTYDSITNHGLMADKQGQWRIRIQSMLDATSQYDVEEVKISLL